MTEERVERPPLLALKRYVLRKVLPHRRRFAVLLGLARLVRGILPPELRAKLPEKTRSRNVAMAAGAPCSQSAHARRLCAADAGAGSQHRRGPRVGSARNLRGSGHRGGLLWRRDPSHVGARRNVATVESQHRRALAVYPVRCRGHRHDRQRLYGHADRLRSPAAGGPGLRAAGRAGERARAGYQ